MDYLFRKGSVGVRKMRDSICDYVFLAEWLSTPEMVDYYDDNGNSSDLQKVLKKYSPRVKGGENVKPCIVEYDGIAVGYVQFYEVNSEEYEVTDKLSIKDYSKPMAIDILIGKTDYWNRGIGTETVKNMISYLFEECDADIVVIDPHVDNERAIRCYERGGFTKVGIGDAKELHKGEFVEKLIMAAKA